MRYYSVVVAGFTGLTCCSVYASLPSIAPFLANSSSQTEHQPSTRASPGQLWWHGVHGENGHVTKVKVTKGETPPVPRGSGVSSEDMDNRLLMSDCRDGRVHPPVSQHVGDVEGFLANPSSSSWETVGTAAVSGLDTVVRQVGSEGTADDAIQVSRRIAEEISRVASDEVVLLRFFDIEKAYPRVCRAALWKVLVQRGCAPAMLRVLKAIHEHTVMKVKVYNGVSEGYVPDRGLREGCPSSLVIFNVYHDAVMQDFRARRQVQAADMGVTPGIQWEFKVDGKLCKRHTVRSQAGQETGTVTIGDMGYADDTAIVGEADEVVAADRLFSQVCLEWEEKVHPGKTASLRLSGTGKQRTDVKHQGEVDAVKHVGGWVSETGRPFVENAKRRENVQRKMFAAAQTWTFGGSRIRREACNFKRSVRLTVAKSVVIPTALATCRTRTWNQFMIRRLDQSVKSCLRRCFGLRFQTLHDLRISNEMLRKAAGWPTTKSMVMRASLTWLGHVARMPVHRRPKQMLFGWWKGREPKPNTWIPSTLVGTVSDRSRNTARGLVSSGTK